MDEKTDSLLPGSDWSLPVHHDSIFLTEIEEISDNEERRKLTTSLRHMSRTVNKMSSSLKQTLLGEPRRHHHGQFNVHIDRSNLDITNSANGFWNISMCEIPNPVNRGLNNNSTPNPQDVDPYSATLIPRQIINPSSLHPTPREVLADKYFPVTLGQAYSLQGAGQPPKGCSPTRNQGCQFKKRKSRSTDPKRSHWAGDARVVTRLPDEHTVEPGDQQNVGLSSIMAWCENELARLRGKRIQIEQDRLREEYIQKELAMTREPKPKWYEMKGREFTYEMGRNNDMLYYADKRENISAYRHGLIQASIDLNRSYELQLNA